MEEIRLIDIKKSILSDNQNLAEEIRINLKKSNTFLINLMASPGSGKTSTIIQTIRQLKPNLKIAVIEGDIDSMVDSEKVAQEGVKAVQIRTGGDCHLSAAMLNAGLESFEYQSYDLIIVENVGNLVCPAEFDIGQSMRAMILSVPEGDDKILKYPLMFSVSDVMLVNKIDTISMFDFDFDLLKNRAAVLNPNMRIFKISCASGEGIEAWCEYLMEKIEEYKKS